jgi:hypothetical protein
MVCDSVRTIRFSNCKMAIHLVQIPSAHVKDITMNTFRRTLLCITSASLLGLGAYGMGAIAATPIALNAKLAGANEVPYVMTNATGAHFHGLAMPGQNASVIVPITGHLASPITGSATLSPSQAADLVAGKWYVNLHTAANPDGEARGQVNAIP